MAEVFVKYLKVNPDDLEYDDKFLERGTYGDVKKARWQGKDVAVKMFSCSKKKGGFSDELVCLSMLHEHPNIVDLYGAHLGDPMTDRPFLVVEFASHSLEKVLHVCRKELSYTVDHVMSWTLHMSMALEFIHSKDMLHRDIKPSNILLFKDGRVLKLCDFGTARKLQHTLTNAVGTAWYMAPEVIRDTYYTASCDVYSFGVVLWEMITRHKPYLAGTKGMNLAPQSFMYKVASGGRPPMIRGLPKCLEELISRCWDEAAHQRPTMLEIKTKVERLTKLASIELQKPFNYIRRKKMSQGNLSSQEGRNTQEKSPISRKPSQEDIVAEDIMAEGKFSETQQRYQKVEEEARSRGLETVATGVPATSEPTTTTTATASHPYNVHVDDMVHRFLQTWLMRDTTGVTWGKLIQCLNLNPLAEKIDLYLM